MIYGRILVLKKKKEEKQEVSSLVVSKRSVLYN